MIIRNTGDTENSWPNSATERKQLWVNLYLYIYNILISLTILTGRRLVLMSNPRSHFTEQQQDVCTYVLNAIITAACQKNRTNPKFPLHTEMVIISEVKQS